MDDDASEQGGSNSQLDLIRDREIHEIDKKKTA
jgi:hypothetical protein